MHGVLCWPAHRRNGCALSLPNGRRAASPTLPAFALLLVLQMHGAPRAVTGRATKALPQHVIAGSTALKITPPIDATRDWALMRLDQPVCDGHSLYVDKIAPIRVNRLAARGRLVNVAFHGDLKNWRLAASRNCDVASRITAPARRQLDRDFSDISTLVLHECDTGLASSGSPLLAIGPDNRLKVVAMNVGTYQQTRYLVTGDSVTRRYKPATVANTAVSGMPSPITFSHLRGPIFSLISAACANCKAPSTKAVSMLVLPTVSTASEREQR